MTEKLLYDEVRVVQNRICSLGQGYVPPDQVDLASEHSIQSSETYEICIHTDSGNKDVCSQNSAKNMDKPWR